MNGSVLIHLMALVFQLVFIGYGLAASNMLVLCTSTPLALLHIAMAGLYYED